MSGCGKKKEPSQAGELARIISHDLRSPLINIRKSTDFLLEDLEGKIGEDEKRLRDIISSSTLKCERMLDGLSRYAELDFPTGEPVEINCTEIFINCAKHLQEKAPGRDIKTEHEGLPFLIDYENHWELIFSELIENSLKFQEDGKPVFISCAAEKTNDGTIFNYRDNGVGINSGEEEKIFIIFQKLKYSEENTGIGVGLTLIKKIIEDQKGYIKCLPEINNGAHFQFYIPGAK